MIKRMVGVFLLALVISGCATAPKKYDFNPVCTLDGDYDAVWSAVVEYFAIGNLPIDTIEKDSGLIVTIWMDASRNGREEDKTICDCGGAGMMIPQWTRGKFSVFVKKTAGGGVDLRVTCMFQQEREFLDSYSTVNCSSTGFLEQQIHEYVMAKVQGDQLPDIPLFSPGHDN